MRLPEQETVADTDDELDDDLDDDLAEENLGATYQRLADLLVERSVPAAGQPRFARIEEANERSESGSFQRSQTATVSGAPAGYGRAQLNTSDHLSTLRELHARHAEVRAQLDADGIHRAGLDDLHRRGMAARGWYDAVVRGRSTPEVPREVRAAAGGDIEPLVARFGGLFTQQTGLPAEELRLLAQFRRFRAAVVDRSHPLVAELEEIRASLGNAPPDPQVVQELARRHPELHISALLAAHPGASNRMGPRGIIHYIERAADSNESRASYYTRGAQTSPAWDRFDAMLEYMDLVTSRQRHINNYLAARAIAVQLSGFDALDASEQTILIGQMARMAHGGAGRFRQMFGSAEQPTIHSVDEYRAVIAHYFRARTDTAAKIRRSLTSFTRNLRDVLGALVDDRTDFFLPAVSPRRERRRQPRPRGSG